MAGNDSSLDVAVLGSGRVPSASCDRGRRRVVDAGGDHSVGGGLFWLRDAGTIVGTPPGGAGVVQAAVALPRAGLRCLGCSPRMVAQHSVDVGDNAGAAHVIVHLSDFGRDCDYRFGRADALFVGIDLKVE